MDGETNIEVAYDTQDIEDNPQLHPLRDALMRARQRRDESMAVREKLEAEVSRGTCILGRNQLPCCGNVAVGKHAP